MTKSAEAGGFLYRARHDENYWSQSPHPIALHARTVWVNTDIPEQIALDEKLTWLVQFGGPLEAADRVRLSECGIEVLLPSAEMAWHVRACARTLRICKDKIHPALLGWIRLRPEDKFLPSVRKRIEQSLSALEKTSILSARLELYPDAPLEPFLAQIKTGGLEILHRGTAFLEVRSRQARLPAEFFLTLAAWDSVYAVGLPRAPLRVCNVEAAAHSNVTVNHGAPRNLSGAGINVMVRDESRLFAHPDFGTRVTLAPDVENLSPSQHSTHIAGTIGGNGSLNPMAQGVAYNCNLVSFELNGDDYAEPLSAKKNYNAWLSNHSYGFVTGWDNGTFTNNQSTFGQYGSFARTWDALVQTESIIMVKAVGNDRNDTGSGFPHDGTLATDGEYYDCVDESSTSKNVLVVGAAADSAQAGIPSTSTQVLASSSSGPCNDGRLRPELVANGDTLLSCNNSNLPGAEYLTLSGSSMAAAVVTGATALFLERYQQRFGSGTFPAPHYIRADYAQTATDMGRAGPDYLHGFGMLDLNAALNLFEADNGNGQYLHDGSVSAALPERFYALNSDGVAPIQATLCWTDEPGDLLSAHAIVNDLDVRLIRVSDRSETLPYRLNALQPEQPATQGVNTVDTIEQIRLSAPTAGQYILAVKGTKLSTHTSFTLASSHALTENQVPICVVTSSATSGPAPLTINFDGTSSIDPDGSIVQYLWNFGDGASATGATVQHTFATGIFGVKLTVTDNGGAQATSTITVGLPNQPPSAVAAASPDTGLPPFSTLFSALGSSDPDGTIVKYLWEFGDGTSSSGANVTHTYAASGFYFASLILTDNGGLTAKARIGILAGKTLHPQSSKMGLNFKRPGSDSFSLSTKSLPCDPKLNPAGLSGGIQIGTLEYRFTLDKKGLFKAAPLSIQFIPSKKTFNLTITKASLAGTVASLGARNDNLRNSAISIPFVLSFDDGNVYGFTRLIYNYSARRGVSGTAAFRP